MSKKIRLLSVFIILFIIFNIFSVSVSAEGVYATIESASVSIEIPQEFSVTSASITPDDIIVYNVDAYMEDTSKKLNITSEKNNITQDLYNFKYLTEKQIEDEIENIKSGNTTLMGKNYQSVSNAIYKEMPEYILFTLYDSKIQGNVTVHYAISYTLINGELVTIQYSSASGAFSSYDTQMFNRISESFYVTALYDKPEKVDMLGIFHKLFIVVVILGIIIAISLTWYYLVNRTNSTSAEIIKNRRQLSEKYYKELKNEGLMEDIKSEAEEFINENIINSNTVIEPSENVRPKNPDQISAIIEEASGNPTLIEDEWDDIDLKSMFQKPDKISELNNSNEITENINNESLVDDNIKSENYVETEHIGNNYSENYVGGRADSAKRYAKLFIGSDVEHKDNNKELSRQDTMQTMPIKELSEYDRKMAEIEKRHRQRVENSHKGFSKKHRSSIRNSNKSSKITQKHKKSNSGDIGIFAEFELDNYWDKYRK